MPEPPAVTDDNLWQVNGRENDEDKWYCAWCRKAAYESESRGWAAIRTILALPHRTQVIPNRVYGCPYGNGWHLTSNRRSSEQF